VGHLVENLLPEPVAQRNPHASLASWKGGHFLHQSTAFPNRAAAVFLLQRWPMRTEIRQTMLKTGPIEDAAGRNGESYE